MPLPPSALDQLSRAPARVPGWSGRLLTFSFTVFAVILAVFFGLRLGYRPYLDKQIDDLDREIRRFSQEIPTERQEEIVRFYSQLTNIKTLLVSHAGSARVLAFLEGSTLPSVYYEKLSFDAKRREMTLSGKSRSLPDIGSQLAVFQGDPGVERVDMKGVVADTANIWSFEATVVFKPAFASAAADPASAAADPASANTTSTQP